MNESTSHLPEEQDTNLSVSEPIKKTESSPAKQGTTQKRSNGQSSRGRKKQLEQFEEALKIPGGKRTIKLAQEYQFDGTPVIEIVLDFMKLTGRAIMDVEDEYAGDGHNNVSITPETNRGYLAYVAAHATGYPVDFILDLVGVDFTEVTSQVKLFLLGISRVSQDTKETTEPLPGA